MRKERQYSGRKQRRKRRWGNAVAVKEEREVGT